MRDNSGISGPRPFIPYMRKIFAVTILGQVALASAADEYHHHHHHHHHEEDNFVDDFTYRGPPTNVNGGCTLGNVIWDGAGDCQTSYIEGLSR